MASINKGPILAVAIATGGIALIFYTGATLHNGHRAIAYSCGYLAGQKNIMRNMPGQPKIEPENEFCIEPRTNAAARGFE